MVATVEPGAQADVHARLQMAPPFHLPQDGIAGHQVFIGPDHVAFVFWGADPEDALVRLSGHADVRTRVSQAIAGLTMPRKLEHRFDWSDPDVETRETRRAVAIIARGTDPRPDPDDGRMRGLVAGLTPGLSRMRLFADSDTALVTVERTAGVDGPQLLSLDSLGDVVPVVPLRPLEVLEQMYWFEGEDRMSPQQPTGILRET